jgi:hypothetical protein
MGSKLRNTVRVKNGVRGSSTVFQTVLSRRYHLVN